MPKIKKTVWLWQCNRCGYEWLPRDGDTDNPPKRCPGPNCKSPYWNTPRRQPKSVAGKGKD